MFPVVSWSVIVNIVGTPSTTFKVTLLSGLSVLSFKFSKLIGVDDSNDNSRSTLGDSIASIASVTSETSS